MALIILSILILIIVVINGYVLYKLNRHGILDWIKND